jgi:drug/metabolite transporter (DMT)-like permease
MTDVGRASALRAFILLLLGATLIGNSSVLVRLAEVGPATAAFWRMVLALPVLWLWTAWESKKADSNGVESQPRLGAVVASVLAGLSFAADLVMSNISLGLTSIANFVILVHLAPVIVVVVAWFAFGERPKARVFLALGLALAGAVMLVHAGSGRGGQSSLVGDLLAVAAAFGYAGFILGVRQARMTAGAGFVSLVSSLSCAVGCLVAVLLLGEAMMPPSLNSWVMLLLLGVAVHAIGQGLSAVAVATLGASVTSIVLIYGVLVSIIGAWLVFNEVPGLPQYVGGVMVLGAVILARPR